jgi:hypothetical protein
VTGTVTDDEGRPLPHAAVTLEGAPIGDFTDSTGAFVIEPVREGDYKLTVIHLGHRSSPFLLPARGPVENTGVSPLFRDPGLGPAFADTVGSVHVVYRVETRSP